MRNIPIAKPLSSILGVVIEQYDLSAHPNAAACDALRGMFREHHLILFRGADISTAEQRRMLQIFGSVADEHGDKSYYTLVRNRISPDSDDGDELLFHSDYSFTPTPLPVVSLYGEGIPEHSATTRFANGVRACRNLPADLQARLEGRLVLHASDMTSTSLRSSGPLRPDDLESKPYRGTLHPAILIHPRTGNPVLFINEYLSVWFEGLSQAESKALLSDVFAHLYAPDNVYEHHWRQGDLIIFDNIALQHCRVKGPARTLRRMIVNEAIQ